MGRLHQRAVSSRSSRGRGFTLIETGLATVIIGVGVVAVVEAQQHFMKANAWSSHAATATFLANEIREMTRSYPRHDPVTGLFLADDGSGGQVVVGWGAEAGEATIDDLDDVDDFDQLRFGVDGDLPGPIDAFGFVIPEILPDGSMMLDPDGFPISMRGWSQTVIVEKVDPFNFALVRAGDYIVPAVPPFEGLGVDDFPLRVTVIVQYQGQFDAAPEDVTRVTWIAP